jgi:hypothetical protein
LIRWTFQKIPTEKMALKLKKLQRPFRNHHVVSDDTVLPSIL